MVLFKRIDEFPEYDIDIIGNIYRNNKKLKQSLNNHGYYHVTLCKNGKKHTKIKHRLMALSFLDNPNNLPCVDHINRKRADNSLDNLRWCTHRENLQNKPGQGENYNVQLTKYNTYVVQIRINGKMASKTLKTLQEAVVYRDDILRNL